MPAPALPNLDELISRAGPITAERGLHYFTEGLVSDLDLGAGTARARITGPDAYRVELCQSGERLDFSCNCPHALGATSASMW